ATEAGPVALRWLLRVRTPRALRDRAGDAAVRARDAAQRKVPQGVAGQRVRDRARQARPAAAGQALVRDAREAVRGVRRQPEADDQGRAVSEVIGFGDARIPARVWDKLVVDPVSQCWNWIGCFASQPQVRWKVDGKWKAMNVRRVFANLVGDTAEAI